MSGFFNAESYWRGKAKKVYVVTVEGGSCSLSHRREERLVRAGCDLEAESAAAKRSFLKYPRAVASRLATPDDLLCVGSEKITSNAGGRPV